MYLDISLKEYEIARLENKLMYADDIERVKIRRKLNNLLDRDNLEDYEHQRILAIECVIIELTHS